MNDTDNSGMLSKLGMNSLADKMRKKFGYDIAPKKSCFSNTVWILMDCSGSMSTKMADARLGAIDYANLARESGYAVGLIAFSDVPRIVATPDDTVIVFDSKVRMLSDDGGLTNVAECLLFAAAQLKQAMGKRVVCFVTDGMPNCGGCEPECYNKAKRDAMAARASAIGSGVDIMAVGLAGADHHFLNAFVTQRGFSKMLSGSPVQQGLAEMAKLLPP